MDKASPANRTAEEPSEPKRRQTRREPSQERGKRSREKILEGAWRLLATEGLSGFTMREVARAASVGLGTLYEYFPSRNSILYWLLDKRIMQRLEIVNRYRVADQPNRSPMELMAEFDAEMLRNRMWTRVDVILFGSEVDDEDLARLRARFQDQLEESYIGSFRAHGSTWTDDGLKTIARYLINIDILNIEMQLKAPPEQRHHYRDFTYAIFERAFAQVQGSETDPKDGFTSARER